ncbi:MAG: MFS transporter [Nocardioides sp.]|uniref:MFS transporter n=1 Tax=Nocardioides sp. TaxID=35761 RepID=UPI0039E623FF
MTTFLRVLVNTGIANITTSYLWWSLIFWAYLETGSVLANGLIGGAYMLLVAAFSMLFGTLVDRHRKHRVMVLSAVVTTVAFLLAGVLFWTVGEDRVSDLSGPWFWLFSAILLGGAVLENMRSVALSTTVTLLVPEERHANANGLVGTVQGVGFLVTSVLSGLSVGLLGMGWTIAIALALTVLTFVDLLLIRIPEDEPERNPAERGADLKGGLAAVRAAPGLLALLIFSTFNNLFGGVYMALMDPYGLTLFSVETWGIVLAVCSTGFIIGGMAVARLGLGERPLRTMLIIVVVTGVIGAVFTLREWWWLFALGCWAWMLLMPVIEAAEQTVIQRVVPFATQGRVFGFATMCEAGATPITAFLAAPLAEFALIPYLNSDSGRDTWQWLLGTGEVRGIGLAFLLTGLGTVALAVAAFRSRAYGQLSRQYADVRPIIDAPGVVA